MKDRRNLSNAFGSADEQFVRRVRETVRQLTEKEEKPVMRKKLRVGMALALAACLTIGAVAFAAAKKWGILDFVVGLYNDVRVLPEATDLMENGVEQEGGHTSLCDFTVRQAIYDGENAYVVVAVKPAKDDILLVEESSWPSCPVSDFGNDYDTEETEGMTIADYAGANGKTDLVMVSVSTDREISYCGFGSMDSVLEQDGTLVCMLSRKADQAKDEIHIEFQCIAWPYAGTSDELTDEDQKEQVSLTCTLHVSNEKTVLTSVGPVEYADCGVRVDHVTMTCTPMATYVRIEYTVIDQEKFDTAGDGLWFEFLDENGETLADGAQLDASVMPVRDSDDKQYVQDGAVMAFDTPPAKLVMRGYTCWEKKQYETHEIAMTETN